MDGLQRVEALFSSLADADGVVHSAVMLEVLTTLGGDATRFKNEVKELLGAEGRKSLAEIVQGPVGQFLSSRHDEARDKLSKMEVAVAAVVAARSASGAVEAKAGSATVGWAGKGEELRILRVRLRTVADKWGKKMKVTYALLGGSDQGEVCLGCSFDKAGRRVGDTGEVKKGDTCGGIPNGCVSFKDASAFAAGTTVTLSLRLRKGGGRWSRPVSYTLDPALFERPAMHTIEPVRGSGGGGRNMKDEL